MSVHDPIRIDTGTSVRCDICDWIGPGDPIVRKDGNQSQSPEVVYPDGCRYCGLCRSMRPVETIAIVFPDRMNNNGTDIVSLLGTVIE